MEPKFKVGDIVKLKNGGYCYSYNEFPIYNMEVVEVHHYPKDNSNWEYILLAEAHYRNKLGELPFHYTYPIQEEMLVKIK